MWHVFSVGDSLTQKIFGKGGSVTNPLGEELVELLQRRYDESTCTFTTTLPAKPASYAPWPEWVLPGLRTFLEGRDVHKLYSHQVAVAEHAWQGNDVVVATGTSSGKSLGYLLPILTALASDPTACALYLTPHKGAGLGPAALRFADVQGGRGAARDGCRALRRRYSHRGARRNQG